MRTASSHQAITLLLSTLLAGCHRAPPAYEPVFPQEQVIRIATQRVSDGNAHFFTYHYGGKKVNFFVRTDGEGTLRAHFDACYSCYKYKRGYIQQSNEVVCIACRIGYDLKTPVWDFVGACVPITINCQTQNTSLILKASALEKGARFF